MSGTWPDGTPVTPWADPWHDVAGDIRAAMRSAFNGSPYAKPAPPADDDDDPCAAWKRSGSCGIDCPCITGGLISQYACPDYS